MSEPSKPPIGVPRMVQRESGLIVPTDLASLGVSAPSSMPPAEPEGKTLYVVGQLPGDMDTVLAAIDPEALGMPELDLQLDDIAAMLRGVRVEPALSVVGALAATVWHAGSNQAAHRDLARFVFVGRPILDAIERFLRESPKHVVFNEQHLCVLTRLLIEHAADGGGSDGLTDDEMDTVLACLVAISGVCATHGAPVESDEGAAWAPWLVRNGLYFDRTNLGSDQGRAYALFVDQAAVADRTGPNWCDLAEWMSGAPASFATQLAFATALAGFSKALDDGVPLVDRKIGIVCHDLLAGQMPRETVEKLIAASSATRDELRAAFAQDGDSMDHVIWDRAPFERRPFFRTSNDRLILLSPRFLFSWMGEGFYYRLLDLAADHLDPARPSKSSSLRFTRLHGELMERHVVDVARRSHEAQQSAGVVRVFGDFPYEGRDKTESRTSDLVLDFGTDLVVVEVAGGRPPRRARIVSEPAVMLKVLDDRIIGKFKELASATADVLDGFVDLDGLDLGLIERVWPILVTPSTILQSDVLWGHIYDRVPELFADRGSLQPPTLLAIDDFEALMGIVESGHGLPDLLARRLASPYRRMPPSHFLVARFPSAPRPSVVEDALRAAAASAHAVLFKRDC